MKKIPIILFFLFGTILLISGCDLTSNHNAGSGLRPLGRDLVINEVFTISPDKYYAFSWIEMMNASNHTIRWSSVTTPASGFLVGQGGTILTTLDGRTWSSIASGTTANLHAVRFREPDSGYVVGDSGTILRSTDKGRTWAQQTSNTTANLNSVTTSNPVTAGKTAWVCGDGGTILTTFNNGRLWGPPLGGPVPTTNNLHTIDVYSDLVGGIGTLYSCGDGGVVLQSTDAGSNWAKKPANPNYDYYSVTSLKDSAYVVGSNGVMFVSRDKGSNWLLESTKVTVTLRSVFVSKLAYGDEYEPGLVWAVGDSGVIVKSFDNGRTWTQQVSPTTNRLNYVTFIDSLRGWAVGEGGTIIRTDDGGINWSPQGSNTTADLYGAYFYPITNLPTITNSYVLLMYSQRRYPFYDPLQNFNLGTNPNFDFITHVDTGYVLYNPELRFTFRQSNLDPIHPGSLAVMNSDSGKFKDHFNVGPGDAQYLNVSIGFGPSGFCLWSLLPLGEIRLVYSSSSGNIVRSPLGFFYFLFDTTKTSVVDVDVVRYGGFQMNNAKVQELAGTFHFSAFNTIQGADYYAYKVNSYPTNAAAGSIPEWWSLARYQNDVNVDVTTENSSRSFYPAQIPIPGWYSQKSK